MTQQHLHNGHTHGEEAQPRIWGIQSPQGTIHIDEGCVASSRDEIDQEVAGLNTQGEGVFHAVPLGIVGMPVARHVDDAAVDGLAVAQKIELEHKRGQGYGGWDTDCTQQRLSDLLRRAVQKGDPVAVANFCAFLHARKERIAPAQSGSAAPAVCNEERETLIAASGLLTGLGYKASAAAILRLVDAADGLKPAPRLYGIDEPGGYPTFDLHELNQQVAMLHASPDCAHHSRALGEQAAALATAAGGANDNA